MSGTKYSPDLDIVRRCKKSCDDAGESFSEEILLQWYLREIG